VQILRRHDYQTRPWKNGGGRTHEVFRTPATGEPFRWRLSLAEVGGSGPFSDFSGYQRFLTLLDGAFTLRFADGECVKLGQVGDLVRFDGARGVHCEIAGRASSDLNLIVSNAITPVTARVVSLAAPLAVHLLPGATLAIVAVAGAVTVSSRDSAAGGSARSALLATWDAAIDVAAAAGRISLATPPGSPPARVFLAEFSDTAAQTLRP
jgi:environmental stress-induced protein Ves